MAKRKALAGLAVKGLIGPLFLEVFWDWPLLEDDIVQCMLGCMYLPNGWKAI